jgi:serine/threonine protein kinase
MDESDRVSSRDTRTLLAVGTEIAGYTIVSLLGQGGFGDVYKVTSSSNNNFALKTEYKTARKQALLEETRVLLQLDSPYFPKVHAHGETDLLNYCVMDMLGCSLGEIRRNHLSILSSKVVLFLGVEMVKAIQELHKTGFIHRDIKPSNFLLNDSPDVHLVLIDFGLSCPYRDFETGELLPQINGRFFGTKKYSSVNALRKEGLSRRDDMISWLYSMIEFFRGKLPWHSISDHEELLQAKTSVGRNRLVIGKDMMTPREMLTVYDKIMGLGFEEEPPYGFVIGCLRDAIRLGFGLSPSDFAWDAFYRAEMKQNCPEPEPEPELESEPEPEPTPNEEEDSLWEHETEPEIEAKGGCCLLV